MKKVRNNAALVAGYKGGEHLPRHGWILSQPRAYGCMGRFSRWRDVLVNNPNSRMNPSIFD